MKETQVTAYNTFNPSDNEARFYKAIRAKVEEDPTNEGCKKLYDEIKDKPWVFLESLDEWVQFIIDNKNNFKYVNQSPWHSFEVSHWINLLAECPQFYHNCDFSEFSDDDWLELLKLNPDCLRFRSFTKLL